MLYPESEYRKLFHDADKDKDGYIDYLDLKKLILKEDKTFPEHIIQRAFKAAKTRIPPADKMDLPEFLEAMGKLEAYSRGFWTFKGPIVYASLTSTITKWLNTPRFARRIYEEFFHETDTNKDGFITFDEFLVTLKKYGLEFLAKTVKTEFKKHNTRGDGFMSLEEFMIAMGFPPLPGDKANAPIKKTPAAPTKRPKKQKFEFGASLLRQIFTSMDIDKDGVLNKEELRQVFSQLGQEMTPDEVDAMVKANDKDGKGSLTYDEFVNSVYPTVREIEASDDEEEE